MKLLVEISLLLSLATTPTQAHRYALLTGYSDFFEPIKQGFNDSCAEIGAECEIWDVHPNTISFINHTYDAEADGDYCVPIMRYLIQRGDIDGLAVKCNTKPNHPPVLQEASDAGIPTVVFAGPHIGPYASYIGTNNDDVGRAMARLLKQLRPEGGTYATVYNGPSSLERAIGFVNEIEKDNNREDKAHWIEEPKLNYSMFGWGYVTEYKATTHAGWDGIPFVIENILKTNLTAFVFMYQTPTRHPEFVRLVEENKWRNVSIISMDGNGNEMKYLERGIMDGLIGQTTYDTGILMPQVLEKIKREGYKDIQPQYLTNLLNHNLVPATLPSLEVDQSLLGDLQYIGHTSFGIVAFTACLFMIWTFVHRNDMVVKASQPFFLVMTACGIIVMAASLIPLSFDDEGSPLSETKAVAICMSVPWLAFCGFSITFSALFAKTWRVNKFFNSKDAYARIKITEGDVLKPFAGLFTLNVIILTCWTVLDPLTYDRKFTPGTDLWNRDIASNGSCSSEQPAAYLVPLGIVNFCVVVIACWQAVQARDIKSEFAEAKWIGWSMFSMAQAFLTGIPIVVVTKDIPEAFYLTMNFLIFVLAMVVLLLIFVPKIFMHRRYTKMTPMEQKKAMSVSLRMSANLVGTTITKSHSKAFKLDLPDDSSSHRKSEEQVEQVEQPSPSNQIASSQAEANQKAGDLYKKIPDSVPSKKSSYADAEDLEEVYET